MLVPYRADSFEMCTIMVHVCSKTIVLREWPRIAHELPGVCPWKAPLEVFHMYIHPAGLKVSQQLRGV